MSQRDKYIEIAKKEIISESENRNKKSIIIDKNKGMSMEFDVNQAEVNFMQEWLENTKGSTYIVKISHPHFSFERRFKDEKVAWSYFKSLDTNGLNLKIDNSVKKILKTS